MGTAGLFSGSGGGANPAGWLRMLRAGAPARVSSGYAGSRGRCGRRTGWRRVVFTAADGLPRVETRGAGRGGQRILSEPFVGADASQLRFDDAREFVFGRLVADGVVDGATGGGAVAGPDGGGLFSPRRTAFPASKHGVRGAADKEFFQSPSWAQTRPSCVSMMRASSYSGVWSLTALLTAPPVAVPSVKSLSVRVA